MDENNNNTVDDKVKAGQTLHNGVDDTKMIWGWDDTDMNIQDKCGALIINKMKNT